MSTVDNKVKSLETSRPMDSGKPLTERSVPEKSPLPSGVNEPTNGEKTEKSRPTVKKPTWNASPAIKYDGLIKPVAGTKKPYEQIKHVVDDSTPVGYRPKKHVKYIYELDNRPDWNPSPKIDRSAPFRPLSGSKKKFDVSTTIPASSKPVTRRGEPVEEKKTEKSV